MRGSPKALVEEDGRKVPGSWGESAPVFSRNDVGLQPPIQAVVYRETVKVEPKGDFQITAALLWRSLVGTKKFRARKGSSEQNRLPTPRSSASLCHS